MSEDTKAAIEDAIAKHLAEAMEDESVMLGAYVIAAEIVSLAGELDNDEEEYQTDSMFTLAGDRQSTFTTTGLLVAAKQAQDIYG